MQSSGRKQNTDSISMSKRKYFVEKDNACSSNNEDQCCVCFDMHYAL